MFMQQFNRIFYDLLAQSTNIKLNKLSSVRELCVNLKD